MIFKRCVIHGTYIFISDLNTTFYIIEVIGQTGAGDWWGFLYYKTFGQGRTVQHTVKLERLSSWPFTSAQLGTFLDFHLPGIQNISGMSRHYWSQRPIMTYYDKSRHLHHQSTVYSMQLTSSNNLIQAVQWQCRAYPRSQFFANWISLNSMLFLVFLAIENNVLNSWKIFVFLYTFYKTLPVLRFTMKGSCVIELLHFVDDSIADIMTELKQSLPTLFPHGYRVCFTPRIIY